MKETGKGLCLALSIALLAGCDGGEKDNTGEDELSCTETIDELSIEEDSPLGFGGRAITTLTSGEHDATLTYADSSTSGMTLKVSYADGDIRYVDREPPADGGAEWAEICQDTVEVDVTLIFRTQDDAFDEDWETALYAYDIDVAWFNAEFDPLDMVGGFDITAFMTSTDYDELTAFASGQVDLSGTTGTLAGQASGSEDCEEGDECSAWAEQIDIGAWVPVSN